MLGPMSDELPWPKPGSGIFTTKSSDQWCSLLKWAQGEHFGDLTIRASRVQEGLGDFEGEPFSSKYQKPTAPSVSFLSDEPRTGSASPHSRHNFG